jgi:hypothetical protein
VRTLAAILSVCALCALGSACADDSSKIVTVEEPPDAGCLRPETPQTYQVYFVTDVSGSMSPFLSALSEELVTFAGGFSQFDTQGRPTRVDFYLVAFVNDVKWYGGRMTSVIALQASFDEAIARGAKNLNLNTDTPNAEPEENMLDAVQSVIDSKPDAEAKLVLVATDSAFAEAPTVLSGNIMVKSTFATVRSELEMIGARVHAFVPDQLDGLTREYNGQPSLTTLPGSTSHSLLNLTGSSEQIRQTLTTIAHEASCN